MHAQVLDWIGEFRTTDDLSVLDIGGRDLNGTTRALFPNANPYHVLDLRPGQNVDIVANAATWQPERHYDLVVITEVFEHTSQWPAILATARMALRPGGWLLFTCAGPGRPTHSGVEARLELEPGEHYANVAPEEVERVLIEQNWVEIETHLRGTDTQGKAVRPVTAAAVAEVLLEVAPAPTSPALALRDAGTPDTA